MSWNSASFTLSPSEPNFVSTHLGPHCSMSLKRDRSFITAILMISATPWRSQPGCRVFQKPRSVMVSTGGW
jgi:hypothetical protein